MLVASDIGKSYPSKTLFTGLTFTLVPGDRIALIGPNGSGKTTLLDILAGETEPETGVVSRRRNVTLGYLKQEPEAFSGRPLLQEVMDALPELNSLLDEINSVREALATESDPAEQGLLLDRLGDLEAALDAAGGEAREHEAKAILSGLGFRESDFARPMSEFSGGWVMRAGLARILFRNPDLLLLDEPTNHLDLEANLWFERYLASFPGGILVTSHDRAFLNQTVNKVLAIEPDEVALHSGNYDEYLVTRERALEVKHAAAARQEREIQRQMRFVDRFRYKARKASQVQSRLKQLEKMEIIRLPRATKKVNYSFPKPPRSGAEVISLVNVHKSYGDNVVYRDLNVTLSRGDRVALVGPNGAGKTTLLRILADVIPFEGERKTGHNVTTTYYAQHVLELLDRTHTLVEELRQAAPAEPDQNLRNTLGGFLFAGDDVDKKISVLSGGKRPGWPWPSCSYSRATSSSWMSQPTTWISPPGKSWPMPWAITGAPSASSPTTAPSSARSPTRSSRLMGAASRFTRAIMTATFTGSRPIPKSLAPKGLRKRKPLTNRSLFRAPSVMGEAFLQRSVSAGPSMARPAGLPGRSRASAPPSSTAKPASPNLRRCSPTQTALLIRIRLLPPPNSIKPSRLKPRSSGENGRDFPWKPKQSTASWRH